MVTTINQYSKTFNDTDGDGVQDVGESDLSNPTHDADGNMEQDANYDYTHDPEPERSGDRLRGILSEIRSQNRLIQRTPRTPSSGKLCLSFSYDYRGRRVRIFSEYHTGSAWANFYDETILYDGWNPVMHYSKDYVSAPNWRKRSYTWGLDLSGTLQGARGVGGLLSVTGWLVRGSTGYDTLRYYYTFDGNGNVSEIINYNSSNAYALCAHYEYDAFGNLTRVDDNGGWSISRTNPFRFSTKWHDNAHFYEQGGSLSYTLAASKLYYYGYRFYAPEHGRWLNRDPIEEDGGINLYQFNGNDSTNSNDYLGLQSDFCKKLLAKIHRKSAELQRTLDNYDRVSDGMSHPIWRLGWKTVAGVQVPNKKTSPGGHYRKILALQAELELDIYTSFTFCTDGTTHCHRRIHDRVWENLRKVVDKPIIPKYDPNRVYFPDFGTRCTDGVGPGERPRYKLTSDEVNSLMTIGAILSAAALAIPAGAAAGAAGIGAGLSMALQFAH